MIQVRRTLTPVDGTSFHEICSFETDNYIGIYVEAMPVLANSVFDSSGYIIMPKNDLTFFIDFIKEADDEDLEHLDSMVFNMTEEHITGVSTSRCLNIEINED